MEEYSSEHELEQIFEEKLQLVRAEKEEEEDEDKSNNKRDWMSVPGELLSQMLTHLELPKARLNFHKVCKYWDSIEDPKEHCPLTFPTLQSQWLVHKDTYYGTFCKFFHPLYLYTNRYTIATPELASAVILHSNNGWLLMASRETTLFFINSFTKERVDLPETSSIMGWKSATFVSDPTSPDCKVFGVVSFIDSWVSFHTINRGENSWDNFMFEDNNPLMFQSECHPVFHNQKLYCLGKDGGHMGVFDPEQRDWTIHKVLCAPSEDLAYESYLVECDGQLMAVFLSYMGKKICVVRLLEEENKMEWKKVESLGDFMMFISVPTSFARKKTINGMENKIYFPRMFGDYIVFYCLATERYMTFGNNFYQKQLFGTREQLNCCWTEPTAHPSASPQQLLWAPKYE